MSSRAPCAAAKLQKRIPNFRRFFPGISYGNLFVFARVDVLLGVPKKPKWPRLVAALSKPPTPLAGRTGFLGRLGPFNVLAAPVHPSTSLLTGRATGASSVETRARCYVLHRITAFACSRHTRARSAREIFVEWSAFFSAEKCRLHGPHLRGLSVPNNADRSTIRGGFRFE